MLRGATSRHGTIRQVFVFLYDLRVFLRVYLRALALSFLQFASLFFCGFFSFGRMLRGATSRHHTQQPSKPSSGP